MRSEKSLSERDAVFTDSPAGRGAVESVGKQEKVEALSQG